MQCCMQCTRLTAWCHSYDDVQKCAVVLLYLQVLCSLIGSLGAFYTGVLVANLAVALFGLVAVESGSQTLGRAYAAFLALSLLVDILWFVFFSIETSKEDSPYKVYSTYSVGLVFSMQVTGFTLRVLSSILWVQIYKLGARADDSAMYHPVDFEGRITTFGVERERPPPSHAVSMSEEILGGAIYSPSTFPSFFQSSQAEPYFGTSKGPQNRNEATLFNGPNMSSNAQPSDSLLERDAQHSEVT